jgi:2-hydroxycyclohexanecarboxyl-CoA dehydrogenase
MTNGRQTAVVTGGAGGIGVAIARALTGQRMAVALWDVDGDRATSAAAEVGGGSIGVQVDITDRGSVEAALDVTESGLGELAVLVNNAGIDVIGAFVDSSEADWRRIVDVNFLGTVRCCHVVVPGMVGRGHGRIINIASDAGRVGSSGEAVYSGTKGGVIAFTKALARETARHGITANCVCPGPTDTPFLDQVAWYSQGLYDGLARAIPMRRVAVPDDVAPAVAFLASTDAGYITGQTLSVSGGLTMS